MSMNVFNKTIAFIFIILPLGLSCIKKKNNSFENQYVNLVRVCIVDNELNKRMQELDGSIDSLNIYGGFEKDTTLALNGKTYFLVKKNDVISYRRPYVEAKLSLENSDKFNFYLYYHPKQADGVIGIFYFKINGDKYELIKKNLGHFETNYIH